MKKVIPLLLLSAVAAIYAQDCTTLTEDECHRNSSCIPINYKSCCGEQQFGCYEGTFSSCNYVNSCYRASKSFDVIEATNECYVAPPGYEKFTPQSQCSEDKIKECASKGQQCIFKRNTCQNPTSCCPGEGVCEGGGIGEPITIGLPTSTTTGAVTTGLPPTSSTTGAVTIGLPPTTTGAVTIGLPPTSSTTGAVTIGLPPSTTTGAVTIGLPPTSTTTGPVTIGLPPTSSTTGAVTIGLPPTSTTTGAVTIGLPPTSSTTGAVTIGLPPTSSTTGSVTIGLGGESTTQRDPRIFNFCENVYCPVEYHCEYSLALGKTQCIADVCRNVECAPGQHCEKNNENGFAHCVVDIAATGTGISLTSIGGSSSTTGQVDVCANVQCPPNFHCEKNNESGNAHCVADIAATGTGISVTSIGGSSSTTGPIFNLCDVTICPPNTHCEINNNGFAQCAVNIQPL